MVEPIRCQLSLNLLKTIFFNTILTPLKTIIIVDNNFESLILLKLHGQMHTIINL